MPFDISKVSVKYRIQHPELDDVFFIGRPLKMKEGQKILKSNTTKVEVGRRGKRHFEDSTDGVAAASDMWEEMIDDWEGIEDKGKPIECNKANRSIIFDMFGNTLCNWVMDEINDVHEKEIGISQGN